MISEIFLEKIEVLRTFRPEKLQLQNITGGTFNLLLINRTVCASNLP